MVKMNLAGASALALGVALAGGSNAAPVSVAARTVTAAIADYNAALVAQTGGTLTVNPGLAVYSVTSGSLEINSRFTVTLPSGFSFFSQPSVFPTDAGAATLTLISGGIGSQTATFQIRTAPVPAAATLTTDVFSVQGATALETPVPAVDALPIAMQATNNSLITNNDPTPIPAGAFASEPGLTAVFAGDFNDIDLGSPALGTQFGGSPDTPTIPIGTVELAAETSAFAEPAPFNVAVLSPNGAINSLASTDTATVTIAGLFNGIKTAFAATDDTCQSVVASGSATTSQITIPGVPIGPSLSICVTADGQTLLRENDGFTGAVAAGSSTDFLGTGFEILDAGLITYSGGGVISVTNFFTGDDSGYTSLLRVNNAGTGPATLYALVQPDTGGPALAGLIGSLGAGMGTVFTEAQVQANVPGLNLANSGQRSTLQLIVAAPQVVSGDTRRPAATRTAHAAHGQVHPRAVSRKEFEPLDFNFTAVSAAGFLVNPSGMVTLMPNPGQNGPS